MSARCDRPTAMETEYAGTPRSALWVPSIGSKTRVASPPRSTNPSLLAQDVEPGVLIVQHPQDGLFRDAVDSGAWGPIRAAAEHLRGVLGDLRNRVLDGV